MKESSLQRKPGSPSLSRASVANRACGGGGGAKEMRTSKVGDSEGPYNPMAVAACFGDSFCSPRAHFHSRESFSFLSKPSLLLLLLVCLVQSWNMKA